MLTVKYSDYKYFKITLAGDYIWSSVNLRVILCSNQKI